MGFIDEKCTFEVLTEEVLAESLPFSCGEDDDMDEFFLVPILHILTL